MPIPLIWVAVSGGVGFLSGLFTGNAFASLAKVGLLIGAGYLVFTKVK